MAHLKAFAEIYTLGTAQRLDFQSLDKSIPIAATKALLQSARRDLRNFPGISHQGRANAGPGSEPAALGARALIGDGHRGSRNFWLDSGSGGYLDRASGRSFKQSRNINAKPSQTYATRL